MTRTAAPAPPPSAVRAAVRITAAPDGRGGTALPVLAGSGPLAVRRTRGPGGPRTAQATLVGAMAGPLGGDRLRIEAEVRAGAALRVTSAAATVALPGRGGEAAHCAVVLRVEAGAVLEWLPEPVVAAAGSRLLADTRIDLAPGARLLLREEHVLGRYGEEPGRITSRLTVRHGGRTVLDQRTDLGPGAPGWDGPAVLAGHRACGHLLHAAPGDGPPVLPAPPDGADAALLPLPGCPAVLLTAAAPDALALRRLLPAPAPAGSP
ncbi:urease accessory protein UreD [Streptacidiphilus sp. ASG 303]|uniref:urease accessory protein UreD n=1 Tax=Streptacidiphilus sp. ASG 303 TaxID=2896847 RepID=UPI001E48BDFB|nr:urease accessory protein UreD [Streptacidiphilus sp. ASG 303]MCD0480949.1 urease accessory protein UreD [Streptacidiphilus sp. ASG 303]